MVDWKDVSEKMQIIENKSKIKLGKELNEWKIKMSEHLEC